MVKKPSTPPAPDDEPKHESNGHAGNGKAKRKKSARRKKSAAKPKPKAKSTAADESIPAHIKGPAGQGKKYSPTKDDRRKVVLMKGGVGLTNDQVAMVMGVAESTLRLHYREELKTAKSIMISKVGGALLKVALEHGARGQIEALKLWLKTQARWSATELLTIEHKLDEAPSLYSDLRLLDKDKLRALETIAEALNGQRTETVEQGQRGSGASGSFEGGSGRSPSRN